MSHFSAWPVTTGSVPTSRRQAFAHRGERLGEQIGQGRLRLLREALFRLRELPIDDDPLIRVGAVMLLLLQTFATSAESVTDALRQPRPERRSLRLDLGVGQRFEARFVFVNRVNDGLDALQLTLEARPHHLGHQRLEHCPPSDTTRAR